MRLVFALIVALIPIVTGAGYTAQEILEIMKNREHKPDVRLPEEGRRPLIKMQRIESGKKAKRPKTAAEILLGSAPGSPRSPRPPGSPGSPGRSNSGLSVGSPGSPGRSNPGRSSGSPGSPGRPNSGSSHGSSLPRTPPAGKQSRADNIRGAVVKGISKVGGCITACILGPGSMAGRKRG